MNGFGVQTRNVNDIIRKIEQEIEFIKKNYDKNVTILINKLNYCASELEVLKAQLIELQSYSETEYENAQNRITSLNEQLDEIRTKLNTIQYNEVLGGKCASGINEYPIYARYAEKDINGNDLTATYETIAQGSAVSANLLNKINEEKDRATQAETSIGI